MRAAKRALRPSAARPFRRAPPPTCLPPLRTPTIIWDETIDAGGYASRRLPRAASSESRRRRRRVRPTARPQRHATRRAAQRRRHRQDPMAGGTSGAGALLLSDMGRVLMTIVGDTSERHDCLCGVRHGGRTNVATATPAVGGANSERARSARPRRRQVRSLPARRRARASTCSSRFASTTPAPTHLEGDRAPGASIDLRAEMTCTSRSPTHPIRWMTGRSTRRHASAAWRGCPRSSATGERDPFVDSTPRAIARVPEHRTEFLLGMLG